MVRLLSVLAAAWLASACAPRVAQGGGQRTQEVTTDTAKFWILYGPEDADSALKVRQALEVAAPRIARWGGLRYPVTITIHPSHDALEAAVHRQNYDWLRAWARFQTIELQSPRTWSFFGGSQKKLEELVTHELTHCAMYQLAGDDLTWMYKEIPRWYAEGVASVTAGQGYRYGGVEVLFDFYQDKLPGSGDGDPGRTRAAAYVAPQPGDPIVDPDTLYQDQSHVVYGAAHHAAEFLVARYGEGRVLEVMKLMGTGLRFPAAFREAIGITDAEFAADFRRYVVWQGWRR
ncbi:MAG TPA: hypothetical protein VF875_01440 [Anaeromyxobacter sp.]